MENRKQEEKRVALQTPRGEVSIQGPVSTHLIEKCTFHHELANFRPPPRQKEALIFIAGLPEGMVYTALYGGSIIGYTTFHRPHKFSRWSRHPRILELGTIEVAPEWRRYGVGKKLLEVSFTNPSLEEYVVITTEFSRHWDLRGSCLSVWQYQKMLTKLFGTVGMQQVHTDDPSILEHPANVLMVRFGKNTGVRDRLLFAELQFEKEGSEARAVRVT
ncbi:MAG: GNAT family N-acetyltransferase [Desulfotomaculales bacterium]